jgi:hypothetical protein
MSLARWRNYLRIKSNLCLQVQEEKAVSNCPPLLTQGQGGPGQIISAATAEVAPSKSLSPFYT